MKGNLSSSGLRKFLLPCARVAGGVFSAFLLLGAFSASAQTSVTSNPANGATGVSVSADVVFTFSAAVDPTTITASFYSTSPFGSYPVDTSWNGANTVLTCTPNPDFPANVKISWLVGGEDANMGQVFAQGGFTVGTGTGGGGGSGTNATTTFSAGKLYLYEQTNSATPTPYPFGSYGFTASTSLASNRTATAVTLKIPTGSVSNLVSFSRPEDYSMFASSADKTNLEATFPQGDYVFNVAGTPADLQAAVTLPTTMVQPNVPHVTNFDLAQAVNPAQAFTVSWDAFQNGTAADAIVLSVSDQTNSKTVFETPFPGTNGALTGTALSAAIPAGKLAANSMYDAELAFYRFVVKSNATYTTFAYRASGTLFTIATTGSGTAVTPVVSKPVWSGNGLGFDVATTVNQVLKVRFWTDCTLPIAQWQTILTTNSPGTSVHIAIPPQVGANGFIRIQNGQ